MDFKHAGFINPEFYLDLSYWLWVPLEFFYKKTSKAQRLHFFMFHPFSSPLSMSSAAAIFLEETLSSNPLLQNFDFALFDCIDVRPGICALLQLLVCCNSNIVEFPILFLSSLILNYVFFVGR